MRFSTKRLMVRFGTYGSSSTEPLTEARSFIYRPPRPARLTGRTGDRGSVNFEGARVALRAGGAVTSMNHSALLLLALSESPYAGATPPRFALGRPVLRVAAGRVLTGLPNPLEIACVGTVVTYRVVDAI